MEMYEMEDFLDTWPGRILFAAGITLIIWGAVHIYHVGVRKMEESPPQVVVDKSHSVRSYSCGRDCVTSSDEWTLLAESGDWCNVGRREYAQVKVGLPYKCPQLFGWR